MKKEFVRMHRLFRRIQQRNRFVDTASTTGVSLLDTHILIEIQASGETLTRQDIAALFVLDSTSLSRTISQLQERKYLAKNSRSKSLSLGAKANKLIEKVDQQANQLIQNLSKELSTTEFDQLIALLDKISDYHNQPQTPQRASDTKFRVAQRRVTRAFHLLGKNVFQSDLTSLEWHALAEVVLSGDTPIRVVELAGLLSVPQNTLTSSLDKLESQDLVERIRSSEDKRIIHLHAKEAGVRFYHTLEDRAVSELEDCFRKDKASWIKDSVNILSKYAGDADGSLPPLLPHLHLTRAITVQDIKFARGLAARISVAQSEEENLPCSFLSPDNLIFVLFSNDKDSGVLELEIGTKPQIIFECYDKKVSEWARSSVSNWIALHTQSSL